jgi:hypothetical protein
MREAPERGQAGLPDGEPDRHHAAALTALSPFLDIFADRPVWYSSVEKPAWTSICSAKSEILS